MKKQDALVRLQDDKYYILASSSYADDRECVLNYEDSVLESLIAGVILNKWGVVCRVFITRAHALLVKWKSS